MKKTLAVLATAAILATAALSTPAEARHGRVAAGIFGGLVAGAILGSALYGPGYYYYDAPGPVYYGPDCFWERQRVWNGRRWRVRRVRVCD